MAQFHSILDFGFSIGDWEATPWKIERLEQTSSQVVGAAWSKSNEF